MTALDALLSRVSVSDLREPGPSGPELELILQAGLRAPDHGKLRPWRFVLIRGAARSAWAEAMVAALLARDPAAPEAAVQKQRNRALNTPLIVAVAARLQQGHKIPEIEQMLSVGAAAMNLLNAVHALGYGGVWLTGANAYDPAVRALLDLGPTDALAGFLFVGTPAGEPRAVRRPDLAEYVTEWTGAPAAPLDQARPERG